MGKGRMEAFSDGVLAIILTIMVLELKAPLHDARIEALKDVVPAFASYVLCFVYVGIYWNNHHHLLHAARTIDGAVLWANLHLLFWLSFVPFTTAWMGENHFASAPVAIYGVVLLMAAIAYYILQLCIIRHQGQDSLVAAAVGSDLKGKVSPLAYVIAIPMAFVNSWVSGALIVGVAILWLVPDKRIERVLAQSK